MPSVANMSKTTSDSVIIHDSSGLKFKDGPPNFNENSSKFENVEEKIKYITISSDGNRVAWIANKVVCVTQGPEWKRIGTLQHPKALEICFSPKGNYLAVWDIYSQAEGAPPPQNLSIYDVTGRKLMKSFTQKSHEGWQPQWTKDESVMARKVGGEVQFYEGKDLDACKHKKSYPKINSFSLSPSVGYHMVTFFIPSMKAAPAFVHLYKYPNFANNAVLASKSFFKVATVETFWNNNCTAVLLLTTGEIDKSGASYYGEQMLFFMNSRGNSIRVTFSKKGSIRSVAWCPSGKEFFCVYGVSPAKATIFNLKCDAIAEFGEGARNIVSVNPQGNLVLLGGMGNISSRFEIWDVKERQQISKQECSDITHMEWLPCGQHILTATCSPRLRVNNGFKIWHYTGSLLHENLCTGSEELFRATSLPDENSGKPFEISLEPVSGIKSEIKAASAQRYVPPSQRASLSGKTPDTSTKFLSQYDEPAKPEDPKEAGKEKKKQKRKEKKEEEKKKKEEEKGMTKDWREEKKPEEDEQVVAKRKKAIKKKLSALERMKAELEEGTNVTDGLIKKINSIDKEALMQELKELENLSVS